MELLLTRRGEGPASKGGAVEPPELGVTSRVVVEPATVLAEQFAALKSELLAALKPAATPSLEVDLPTLGELVHEWLEWIRPQRVDPRNEERLARHLFELYLEDERSLTSAMAEEHLRKLLETLSPATVNKVRGVGRLAIQRAMATRRWSGAVPNPFALVRRQREPRRKYETLTPEELLRVQAELRPDRRRLFRVMLHLGLRTGEAFALRKEDIDFVKGTVQIHRSHHRDETKTGRARVVPLLLSVVDDLYEAIRESKTDLLFGDADGALQRYDTKLSRVLRSAMARAGVGIVEVTYKCRRCGSSETIKADRVSENVCTCGMTRWPVPKVKPIRWYDLRHMCATLHHTAGADQLAISITLGHAVNGDDSITSSIYTHLSMADLHREMSMWALPRK
ncbi:MAG: tyrosine-type recombinase/integrase [Myxococcota bacterium]